MIRRGQSLLIVALAVFALTARAYCYEAQVTDISGTKYFPAVKEALSKAEKSIYVAMFTIGLSPSKENSKASQLIDTLIEAKKRGVDVEVVLDQNVDFVSMHPAVSDRRVPHLLWGESKIKSTRAFQRLKDAGIKVSYDEPTRYLHAKAVIIDKKTVILGSTNWTESAFDKSIEASVLIDSGKLAEELLGYLKTVKIDTEAEKYMESIGPSTPLTWEFLENPELMPLLVKEQAERAFDVYLFLLKNYNGNPEAKITLFYDTLAKYLGIYDGWTSEDYRRQIIKVLKKLEQEYKLIKFEPRYAKEATITLLNYQDPAKVYEIPQDACFELPDDYFNFSWNRELSLRAKFCLLINLANTEISDTKPSWSKSVVTITKQFGGVGQDVIHKGMAELRRKKLIEVKYDDLTGKPYDERKPKKYRFIKLYDPKELVLNLKEIEKKYGKEAYNKARKYAEIVFEENNPEVIKDIILKTKQYGEKKVNKAFAVVSRQNIDNPKRIYGYVAGIIENTESPKQYK